MANSPVQGEVPYRRLVTADKFAVDAATPLPVTVAGARDPFGDLITTARTPIFAFSSTDDLNILRDIVTETVNGEVTSTQSEFRVNAPASGDSAMVGSAIRGRYVPGYAAEAGVGIRLGSRSTGGSVKWGLYDDDDGLFFRLDDTGLNFLTKRNTVETLDVNLSEANVDRLDGTGPSGIDVDDFGGIEAYLQQGHVFQIRFTWYGYGIIEWAIIDQADSTAAETLGIQKQWVLHRGRIRGNTTVEDPNLPVRITASDGADVYVGGRQYSILGQPDVEERNLGEWRYQQSIPAANIGAGGSPADGDWRPLIAIRRRSDVDWAEAVQIVTDDIEIITDRKLIVQQFIGPTVTGGTWTTPQYVNGSSAVQVNRSGTGVTFPSGTFPNQTVALDPLIALSAAANREAITSTAVKRTNLPEGQELILAAFVPGAQAALVDSVLDWLEIR